VLLERKTLLKIQPKQHASNYNEESDFNLGKVPKLQNSFVAAKRKPSADDDEEEVAPKVEKKKKKKQDSDDDE